MVRSCRPSPSGPDPATTATVPGLTLGQAYTFTVAAENAQGWSDPSAPSEQVTPSVTGVTIGPATPAPPAWEPRETVRLVNATGGRLGLGGYGLWDQNARPLNPGEIGPDLVDTPDFVFPRDAIIPAGELRVRSGEPTASEPASATLLYTGKDRIFDADDRMELAGLNKAPVACRRTTGAACAVSVDKTLPTQPLGVSARAKANDGGRRMGASAVERRNADHRVHRDGL